MAVTLAHILDLMKELGIEKELVDSLKPELPLLEQGMDSVDLPVFVFGIEKKYGINLFSVRSHKVRTLAGILAFLNENADQAR